MKSLIFLIDKLNDLLFKIASVLTLFLVLLTAEQVVARYLFSSSHMALQELQWHLFAAIFILSIGHTLRVNEHVRVDIFYSNLSPITRKFIDGLGYLFFVFPICYVLIKEGSLFVDAALQFTNHKNPDHWSAQYFEPQSLSYGFFSQVENLLRSFVLVGEVSPNPAGLEARWLIKSLIPLAGISLGAQALASFLRLFTRWEKT